MREFFAYCNVSESNTSKFKTLRIINFFTGAKEIYRFLAIDEEKDKDGYCQFETPQLERCRFIRFCDEKETKFLHKGSATGASASSK